MRCCIAVSHTEVYQEYNLLISILDDSIVYSGRTRENAKDT